MVYIELLIAVALIFINGILAMSELAVVSARRGRLKAMADSGSRGAAAALRLADDPGRFLSTVQIGITLVGILAGAFSGATLGARLTTVLADTGMPLRFAEPLAYGGVVALITYLSLIIGELVPKQIALRNAEAVAAIGGARHDDAGPHLRPARSGCSTSRARRSSACWAAGRAATPR